ncbi:MAG: DUF1592 domain-containing protein [Myxococcales bacterium]|nr:DUF1592 domain-containing protein [Myxococcales bacterium]
MGITIAALSGLAVSACTGAVTGSSSADPDSPSSDSPGTDDPTNPSAGGGGAPGAGGAGAGGSPSAGLGCGPLPQRLVRLNPVQLENTLVALSSKVNGVASALAPFAPATRSASGLDLTVPHVNALLTSLGGVSAQLVANKRDVSDCLDATSPNEDCVRGAIERLVRKAFRRPARPAETEAYLGFYRAEKGLDGHAVALEQVANAILLSHNTLFRSEFGGAPQAKVVELTPFEKADFLAFSLSNAPPDAELQAAAEKGDLDAPEGILRESRRLMAGVASSRALTQYFDDLVGVDRVLSAPKNEMFFPQFKTEIRALMLAEYRAFVEHVIWKGDGRLETLLTAPYTFLNKTLGGFYGLGGSDDDNTWKQVSAAEQGRAGLLTTGAFLATYGLDADTDIIRRGLFVREKLLCDHLPSAPGDVNVFPLPPDGANTHRERLVAHAAEEKCALCHRMMDPIGFALENFDSTGVYRTMDARAGKPIDASGYLWEPGGNVAFTGAREMANAVVRQPRAHDCFAQRVEAFVLGQGLDEAGSCQSRRDPSSRRSRRKACGRAWRSASPTAPSGSAPSRCNRRAGAVQVPAASTRADLLPADAYCPHVGLWS